MHDLIIVGGGAAGLWAAIVAAGRGLKVLVLEKNVKSGVKILMSGGTRCNITHHCGPEGIVSAFGNQGRFLKHAVYALPPEEVVQSFNAWGLPTKIEETGKVFPASDRALDVRDVLVNQLTSAGAELRTGVAVHNVQAGRADSARWQVSIEGDTLPCHQVLLCTGGLSYSACGTTGDGYQWAQCVGHTIVPTHPALAPLVSPANWVHELTGITLPDVQVRVITDSKKDKDPRRTCRSSFLWTHFGCSGPAPMNVSRFIEMYNSARQRDAALPRASLQLDLVPDVSEAALLSELDSTGQGRRRISSILAQWLPAKLVMHLLQESQLDEARTVAELPKKSRQQLLTNLKSLTIPIDGSRGYGKAEVTCGGVTTGEVNAHTLESRLAPGLYLAGEILDIDGPIGGFNFQAAFATANAAALNMTTANEYR